MKILVTGAAGFIGFHTAVKLLERGDTVVGLDNFNDYYDVSLKESRAEVLAKYDDFTMERLDLADRTGMEKLFESQGFDKVVHLAAQAGDSWEALLDELHELDEAEMQRRLAELRPQSDGTEP